VQSSGSDHCDQKWRKAMSISLILLIILILLLVGALPTWPHSSGWGYYPSGGLGLVVLVVVILLLMGRI
jgi:polyferredoxin